MVIHHFLDISKMNQSVISSLLPGSSPGTLGGSNFGHKFQPNDPTNHPIIPHNLDPSPQKPTQERISSPISFTDQPHSIYVSLKTSNQDHFQTHALTSPTVNMTTSMTYPPQLHSNEVENIDNFHVILPTVNLNTQSGQVNTPCDLKTNAQKTISSVPMLNLQSSSPKIPNIHSNPFSTPTNVATKRTAYGATLPLSFSSTISSTPTAEITQLANTNSILSSPQTPLPIGTNLPMSINLCETPPKKILGTGAGNRSQNTIHNHIHTLLQTTTNTNILSNINTPLSPISSSAPSSTTHTPGIKPTSHTTIVSPNHIFYEQGGQGGLIQSGNNPISPPPLPPANHQPRHITHFHPQQLSLYSHTYPHPQLLQQSSAPTPMPILSPPKGYSLPSVSPTALLPHQSRSPSQQPQHSHLHVSNATQFHPQSLKLEQNRPQFHPQQQSKMNHCAFNQTKPSHISHNNLNYGTHLLDANTPIHSAMISINIDNSNTITNTINSIDGSNKIDNDDGQNYNRLEENRTKRSKQLHQPINSPLLQSTNYNTIFVSLPNNTMTHNANNNNNLQRNSSNSLFNGGGVSMISSPPSMLYSHQQHQQQQLQQQQINNTKLLQPVSFQASQFSPTYGSAGSAPTDPTTILNHLPSIPNVPVCGLSPSITTVQSQLFRSTTTPTTHSHSNYTTNYNPLVTPPALATHNSSQLGLNHPQHQHQQQQHQNHQQLLHQHHQFQQQHYMASTSIGLFDKKQSIELETNHISNNPCDTTQWNPNLRRSDRIAIVSHGVSEIGGKTHQSLHSDSLSSPLTLTLSPRSQRIHNREHGLNIAHLPLIPLNQRRGYNAGTTPIMSSSSLISTKLTEDPLDITTSTAKITRTINHQPPRGSTTTASASASSTSTLTHSDDTIYYAPPPSGLGQQSHYPFNCHFTLSQIDEARRTVQRKFDLKNRSKKSKTTIPLINVSTSTCDTIPQQPIELNHNHRSLPSMSRAILEKWLFDHFTAPYPTESQLNRLANQTNLSFQQVRYFFVNSRSRLVKPALEAVLQKSKRTPQVSPSLPSLPVVSSSAPGQVGVPTMATRNTPARGEFTLDNQHYVDPAASTATTVQTSTSMNNSRRKGTRANKNSSFDSLHE